MSYEFIFKGTEGNVVIKRFTVPFSVDILLSFTDMEIVEINKITCQGCINELSNQLAHMDKDGCLNV